MTAPDAVDNLFVSFSGVPGGAERLLLDWAPGVGGASAVACPGGRLAGEVERAGLRSVPIRRRPLEVEPTVAGRAAAAGRLAAQAVEIRGIIRRLRPAVIIAWSIPSLLAVTVACAAIRRPPPVVFQHNDLLPQGPTGSVVRAAARRSAVTVVPSQDVATDLDPDRRLAHRLRVVHPGVDLDHWTPSPVTAGDGDPEVLVLGAIVGWKRPDVALEAVALAAPRLPGLRLVVAGEPLDRDGERLLEELRRRAARPDLAGRVDFVGRLEDPRSAVARSRCLLHCADREPFGLVLVEALAAGRPVVAPAAGGPAEIVDDGCGRLFAPGDAEQAAEALVETLAALETTAELGRGGRRRAEAHFDIRHSRKRFADVVRDVRERPARDR